MSEGGVPYGISGGLQESIERRPQALLLGELAPLAEEMSVVGAAVGRTFAGERSARAASGI